MIQVGLLRPEFADEHLRAWKATLVSILPAQEAFPLLLDGNEHRSTSHRSYNSHPMKGLFDRVQDAQSPVQRDLSKLVLYDPYFANDICKARFATTPLAK
jgi:hypothetical protein